MRSLLFSICFLVFSISLLGQAEPLGAESTVRQALESIAQGTYKSTDQKELGWLGDASAVALTKIIGGRALDGADIRSILMVVTMSYAAPSVVAAQSDREPRTTLFLLRSLDLSTADPALKRQIAATRVYVTDQYARYLKEPKTAIPKHR
jgi:hypothetical protein